MRVTSGNTQFFKTSLKNKTENLKNTIWINLTSNNGVFNQIAVAYLDGATDGNDGSYFDAKKIIPTEIGAIMYSLIDEDENKFVIQGKNLNSLNLDEKFNLGLKTSINVATQYTLSIPKLQGDFVKKHSIYLKDNELNLYHELSESDYDFTAEAGEYNNRFEIVFKKNNTLAIDDLNSDEPKLTIFELEDGTVQFKVNDSFQIKNITIIDLLGRTLYTIKGNSYTETLNISRLSNSMYIAKVELSNGNIIIKKAIKRKY